MYWPSAACVQRSDRELRDESLTKQERAHYAELTFEDRLGLLVDDETQVRSNRRLERNLKAAKLQASACVEEVDFRAPRGIDRSVVVTLATRQWVTARQNLLTASWFVANAGNGLEPVATVHPAASCCTTLSGER